MLKRVLQKFERNANFLFNQFNMSNFILNPKWNEVDETSYNFTYKLNYSDLKTPYRVNNFAKRNEMNIEKYEIGEKQIDLIKLNRRSF